MDTLISQYIESKKFAWSPSTIRSERYRLYGLSSQLNANPIQLWEHLVATQKPYSRSTSWTRVVEFYNWLIEEGKYVGPNPYKVWRKRNAKVFKNVYTKTTPEISYEEARERINSISQTDIQKMALQLLDNGLRYNETKTIHDGTVIGKGGKSRRIYVSSEKSTTGYSKLYRALKEIGLKPHDLRKIFLSRLVELGANPFELCEIAGWEDIKTASSYIKVNSNRIKELVEMVHKV